MALAPIATDDGRRLLARAKREGWEGLIVKDAHGRYDSGRRSPAWRKLKLSSEQEFVVGGWTAPRESRAHFGALVLGYYDAHGLRWAGSVGTGFDQRELDTLARLLARHPLKTSPFVDKVSTRETPHWVKPELVAEVRFTEWTSDGLLRHPVYLGLRDDKRAREVRRESNARPAMPHGLKPMGSITPVRSIAALFGQLERLEHTRKDGDVRLPNGDTLHVTHLSKVFWPGLGITKGELLRYYAQVSPLLLPVVADRPLVMRRFPN